MLTKLRPTIRFSLRGLLVVTAILAMGVCGCGWIHWPALTASSFIANSHIDPSTIVGPFGSSEDRTQWTKDFAKNVQQLKCQLKPRTRSWFDVLLGAQAFDYGPYDIYVRRGKVTVDGPYWDFGFGKMTR